LDSSARGLYCHVEREKSRLQQQSRLFLRPAYTEDDIAQLLDSDGDNEVIDEYDGMT
jgi:hypothetical protein